MYDKDMFLLKSWNRTSTF